MAGTPFGNNLGSKLARSGVGGKDAGVNVKQFHGGFLERLLRIAAMDKVCGRIQYLISRQNCVRLSYW
jgi:hypothetical protein